MKTMPSIDHESIFLDDLLRHAFEHVGKVVPVTWHSRALGVGFIDEGDGIALKVYSKNLEDKEFADQLGKRIRQMLKPRFAKLKH